MRFLGTLKVELNDGTVEKFKDRTDAKEDEPNDARVWWTHTFEELSDNTLVVTRQVASIDDYHWGGKSYTMAVQYEGQHITEYDVEVARYAPGMWRTIKRA